MIMRAQALLQKNPRASEAEIRAWLEPQSVPLRHPYAHPARGPRAAAHDDAPAQCGRQRDERRDRHFAPRGAGRSGALIVSFSSAGGSSRRTKPTVGRAARRRLRPAARQPQASAYLDSWIRVDADGAISVFTGKAEFGQGIKTALIQIAAEQLDVDRSHQARHRRHRAAPRTRATPPAATRCRTAAPRS